MEALVVIALLIPIGLVVGAILGVVAFSRVGALQRELAKVKNELAHLKVRQERPPISPSPLAEKGHNQIENDAQSEIQPVEPPVALQRADIDSDASVEMPAAGVISPEDSVGRRESAERESVKEPILTREPPQSVQANATSRQIQPNPFFAHLSQNWMVWLGGLCVALAGVFLAKYSIEQGLIGPATRIAMGLFTGVTLHAVALFVRKKLGGHPALAALAGGGSITLFASLLAALHFYQMFSPAAVFIALALVALATMWLALSHGPVLACIGMIGAFAVPAMVSTGSGNLVAAMAYALIISASVLLLIRQLSTPTVWLSLLWWGLMAGGLFWWAVSLTGHQADGWRGVYLALFAYGLIAFTQSNWRLSIFVESGVWPLGGKQAGPVETQESLLFQCHAASKWLAPSLLLIVVAQIVSVLSQGWQGQWFNWAALSALILWLAGNQPRFAALAWGLFAGQWLALLLPQLDGVDDQFFLRLLPAEQVGSFFRFIFGFAALFVGIGLRNLRLGYAKNWWAAMVAVVPVCTLLICQLLGASFTQDWQWALVAFILGASYVALAVTGLQKQWTQALYVWLFLAGHFAYSLAVSLLFEQATLTLAIAVQVVSIAWLIKRFEVEHLGWLLKTVVVLVVIRLTLNPWLASYPAEAHWPLWTFGGATVFCFTATRWLQTYPPLARWTEAAALHLFVLTLWSEARYWFYEGDAFHAGYAFYEAVLNTLLFGALALVYHYKATLSERMAIWYRGYSFLQLGFALGNYLALLMGVMVSSPWAYQAISSTPVWNGLLVAFGAPVLLGWLVYRFYLPGCRRVAALFTALAGFIFICLQIRHVWQDSIRLDTHIGVGELYTYSIVWLLLAVAALLLGGWRFGKRCYQGGLLLLALVIVKIFLVDMAGLDGLLRVASFMGLGLALLAVAFIHQTLSLKLKQFESNQSEQE